jgi:hypothetical protein
MGRQEKSFLLTWQSEFFLTASHAVLGESCVTGRRRLLSIELFGQGVYANSAAARATIMNSL